MIPRHYDEAEASGLTLLLGSIGREIEERSRDLARIERRIEEFTRLEVFDPESLHALEAAAAVHRRELRATRRELARLGCTLVGIDPPTFRIPRRSGRKGARKSFLWQRGTPLRSETTVES
jgi:hypothetical protein